MNFKQIVYYNDRPIVITNNIEAYIAENAGAASFKSYSNIDSENFSEVLTDLGTGGYEPGAIILEQSTADFLGHLGKLFDFIRAGGGLVYNPDGAVLMIFRRGKWDLPKGKLDKGETIDECALREVNEETGVGQLTLGHKICDTYHIYNEKNKNHVKHTTWFKMTSTDSRALVPQTEEDISEVLWVSPNSLAPYVANTYHAIKDVLAHDGLL